jgi:hypothetical protein
MSGLASAVFVTIANAWMNTPRGFELVHGDTYYRTGENKNFGQRRPNSNESTVPETALQRTKWLYLLPAFSQDQIGRVTGVVPQEFRNCHPLRKRHTSHRKDDVKCQ